MDVVSDAIHRREWSAVMTLLREDPVGFKRSIELHYDGLNMFIARLVFRLKNWFPPIKLFEHLVQTFPEFDPNKAGEESGYNLLIIAERNIPVIRILLRCGCNPNNFIFHSHRFNGCKRTVIFTSSTWDHPGHGFFVQK
jgi:hypothetical protein